MADIGRMKNITLLSLLLLSACATTGNYEANLNSWRGRTPEELIEKWGYPDGTFDHPNGNKVYIYSNSRSTASVSPSIYQNPYTPGTDITVTNNTSWCKTYFEVDDRGLISTWRWEGNACRSY